jgi:hypothetical protein
MQAMYDFVEKISAKKLEDLIEKSDGVSMLRFFREIIFPK